MRSIYGRQHKTERDVFRMCFVILILARTARLSFCFKRGGNRPTIFEGGHLTNSSRSGVCWSRLRGPRPGNGALLFERTERNKFSEIEPDRVVSEIPGASAQSRQNPRQPPAVCAKKAQQTILQQNTDKTRLGRHIQGAYYALLKNFVTILP